MPRLLVHLAALGVINRNYLNSNAGVRLVLIYDFVMLSSLKMLLLTVIHLINRNQP